MFGCFMVASGKKKKGKGKRSVPSSGDFYEKLKALQAKSGSFAKPNEKDESRLPSSKTPIKAKFSKKVMSHESPIEREVAYEGGDEQENNLSIKRDISDFDFQSHIMDSSEDNYSSMMKKNESGHSLSNISDAPCGNKANRDNLSYPGMRKPEFWGSLNLVRSCSFKETGEALKRLAYKLPPSNVKSFEELDILAEKMHSEVLHENNQSPRSVKSHCNADKMMLKRHSLSQILPSQSRKLWWKLLLWSRRNMPNPSSVISKSLSLPLFPNKLESHGSFTESSLTGGNDTDTPRSEGFHGGVSRFWPQNQWISLNKSESHGSFTESSLTRGNDPDTPRSEGCHGGVSGFWPQNQMVALKTMESHGSFTESSRGNDTDTPRSEGFHEGVPGFWPQNQWVDFSMDSPSPRVDQWVEELVNQPIILDNNDDDDKNECAIDYPPSPGTSRSLSRNTSHINRKQEINFSEELMHANGVVQSLNLSSSVAHITCVGLKVIPTLSQFSSLRSINLSGNFIAYITGGSLPKGLHTLNLSRNKLTSIEGLRELTRLRVLDLSYNKISRIGHGLSSCTLIKELYLVGNQINEVEGLHRLLKLSALDLSFNKISTTKSLGQLVANYHTLLALNVLGNPIQKNISEEKLRKAACGLLPKLAYLNKQPITSQKAREVATESVVKAALGNSNWSFRKRGVKKVSHGRSGSSSFRSSSSLKPNSKKSVSARVERQSSMKV